MCDGGDGFNVLGFNTCGVEEAVEWGPVGFYKMHHCFSSYRMNWVMGGKGADSSSGSELSFLE